MRASIINPLAALTVALAFSGCGSGHPSSPTDADAAESSADAAGDAVEAIGGDRDSAADVEADSDAAAAGPMTLVAETFELLDERFCDHDGDGQSDNAIADLGSANGRLLAMALNSFLAGVYTTENYPIIAHFPWVDDLASPTDEDVTMIVFQGIDDDAPPDWTDDYSGEEPFTVVWTDLKECGEPRWAFENSELLEGIFQSRAPSEIAAPLGSKNHVILRGAQATGEISAFGEAGTVKVCGYTPIQNLGEIDSGVIDGQSMLELLLNGGEAFGLATLPGLTPDVDVDGDGLERIVLDADGHVELCVDGDDTPIAGRDCWQDERITDAMSLVLELTCVPAILAATPSWACEDPPEESLWDPR